MEQNCFNAGIIGLGSFLPEKVLTNADLEKMVQTSDEWIVQRTGMSKRRIIDDNMPAYMMGVEASKKAIENAGLSSEDIDLVLTTTFAPDYYSPATACNIQKEIGAKRAAAFDINAACTGFVYGMVVAEQFIKTGFYKNILLVSCEANSRVVDWEDRNTCILFGDGAGAAVLTGVDSEFGLKTSAIYSDGEGGDVITVPSTYLKGEGRRVTEGENARVINLDGSEVMKFAVRSLVSSVNVVLDNEGLTVGDIDCLIPHQANIRIIEGAIKRLKINEDKVFKNIGKYGNMSSASIPVALNEAVEEGKIKHGDNVVLVGFGGGLTWGANLIKWGK